ncbi:Pentatricopeptide repeat-containing protein [Cynara cardunculus var. scolymus]|uniref:Pentatricopeptide repeat-containing protein n=1 Tax=Cynara cardunculus var. scolymus TaxID=59895 RepID=A0A118K6H8_CYNCS|nr:Pentatricopeptide repeat-containing protein [Cynara cardunculus var. scolymus]
MEITTMAQATQLHAQFLKYPQTDPQNLSKIFNFTALSPSGNLTYARHILNSLQTPTNSYFHNTMIRAYSDSPDPIQSISLFLTLHNCEDPLSPTPDILRACADTGALSVGIKLNEYVNGKGTGLKKNVVTALIDMYSKCGCIDSAMRIFNEAVNKDVYVWTAMIAGLASHGLCREAIALFDRMEIVDLKPDEKTMTAVLSACRNMGWVDKGLTYFKNIKKVYNVRPTVQHYGCIVDLLARAGRLEDAQEFIKSMPIEPDAVLWRSLIWACKVHGDTQRVEHLIKHVEGSKMDSTDDCGTYVLLGNVYASKGKWKNKAKVRRLMNQKGLVKPSGHSRIEIDGVIYEFMAGSTCHFEAESIYKKLDEIEEELRGNGYYPKLSEVLLEIDDEEKASQLLHHSEKLAVSFGLIKAKPGTIIRIVKNLRSCEDCHSFMKYISSVYQREILIRDRIRFHHFRNGECSCGDYWQYVSLWVYFDLMDVPEM